MFHRRLMLVATKISCVNESRKKKKSVIVIFNLLIDMDSNDDAKCTKI